MTESLYAALHQLQKEPPVLTKDKKGQVGNQLTKYADLVQVNRQVLTKLNDLGLIWVCRPTYAGDRTFVLAYELRHVATGEALEGQYPIAMSDNSQKLGSAITYARRYALLAVTGIAAEEEDDDGRATDGRGSAQRAVKRATPEQQAQVAQRRPSGPPLPFEAITDPQLKKMQALFSEQGYAKPEERHEFITGVLAAMGVTREINNSRQLTKVEAIKVIDRLEKREDPTAREATE